MLDELTELYNEAANKTIINIALEDKHDVKRAVDGWKSLHTQILFKMDIINKAFEGHAYSADELSIREGVEELLLKGVDHQERVEKKYQALNSHNAPTMRSGSPVSFSVRRQQEQPPQKPRMRQTLRSTPQRSNFRAAAPQHSSQMSRSAAELLAPKTMANTNMHWTTSKSLQPKMEGLNIFDSSFDDNFEQFGQKLSRDDTLKQLESLGTQSQLRRNVDATTDLLKPSSQKSVSMSSSPNTGAAAPLANRRTVPTKAASTSKIPTKPTAVNPVPRIVRSVKPVKPVPSIVRPVKPAVKPPTKAPARTAKPVAKPALKPKQPPPQKSKIPPTNKLVKPTQPRGRSESPARGETKDTETLDSDQDDEVDEMELSEKEIREKMEDQIIEEVRGIDYAAAKQIFNEIVVRGDEVHWDDIAGLETAKNSLKETVVYPFLRPDLFSGLREPARGMLLFGPPGTGKTMLARAVATESNSTFFSISASSLTSKYLGESEKLVRALFQLAKKLSPSIIFVDEIDSLLSSRSSEGENESSRRIKNEFLIQWSDLTKAAAGKDTGEDLQRVLVLAATNLPWAIDEAARRRFVRRQYIPLPEAETRHAQISKLLAHQKHTLDEKEELRLVELTGGFSGSDITALAKDAAMGPLRSLGDKLLSTAKSEIRPIGLEDFVASMKYIRPSVSKENLTQFDDWARKFGSSGV